LDVGLAPDAVDRDTTRLEAADKRDHAVGFRTGRIEVYGAMRK
jgi:hypothetical protein